MKLRNNRTIRFAKCLSFSEQFIEAMKFPIISSLYIERIFLQKKSYGNYSSKKILEHFKVFTGANQFAKNLSISKLAIEAMKLRNNSG